MNVGFIGAGRMTQRRMVNLPAGWETVAVYAHEHITDRYTGAPIDDVLVPTPKDVFAAASIVVVAAPHSTLCDYAWQAFDAGCEVFVEKPGGIPGDRLPSCRVGYNHRFWPGIIAAKHEITGRVLHI